MFGKYLCIHMCFHTQNLQGYSFENLNKEIAFLHKNAPTVVSIHERLHMLALTDKYLSSLNA